MNICPFSYNLIVENIYDDGSVYSRKVLELTDDDLRVKFLQGSNKIASISFAIGYPTLVSVPHSIVNGFKKLLAIAVASEVTFEQVEQIKEHIKDPSAFAAANAAAAPAGGAEAPAEEEAEEEESSSGGGGAGLFGDDSDSDSDSD